MADDRRTLPSVSSLLESSDMRSLLEHTPRPVVVDAIRRTIEAARSSPLTAPKEPRAWVEAVSAAVADSTRPSLRRVLNGPGVVLHTNLGRAPLAPSAIAAVVEVVAGFSNLGFVVDMCLRGSRYVHFVALLL